MKTTIDRFQTQLGAGFRDFALATAYVELGRQAIDASPPTSSIRLLVAPDVLTEAFNLRELAPRTPAVRHGIADLFQSKAIAAWADLLNDLFRRVVEDHLSGHRICPDLGKRQAKLDFSSHTDIMLQIQRSLELDFAFQKYLDRQRFISKVMDKDRTLSEHYDVVRKHVLIRNASQHHQGLVYQDMLKDLGINSITVLSQDSRPIDLRVGSFIELNLPEIDLLKSALFVITNRWRHSLD